MAGARRGRSLGPRQVVPAFRTVGPPVWMRGVGLGGRARLRLDARAVAQGRLGARVDDPFAGRATADHEDHTRAGARGDEDVLRARRAVHEIPGTEGSLLVLDEQKAFAREDEEVLLIRLGVV